MKCRRCNKPVGKSDGKKDHLCQVCFKKDNKEGAANGSKNS